MKKFFHLPFVPACMCFILFGFLFFTGSNTYAEQLNLKFKNNELSADLKDEPIQKIFEYLEKERGLWVEGEKEAPGKKISVKFDKLPLVDGIRRLLTDIDYALIFGREGNLTGVVIINGDTKGNVKIKEEKPPVTISDLPPLNDNIMPPPGDDTMPPPATQLPPVPKGDVMMPPPAKMLPPQVSKQVLETMKKNDKMPPVSGTLPE